MTKSDSSGDNLREGLKAKGRARRASSTSLAKAAEGSVALRNDVLPRLNIENYPINVLKSRARRDDPCLSASSRA
jgi:hypothetical protein